MATEVAGAADRMTIFCKRCVLSNQRPVACREYARRPGDEPPKIQFVDGVCAACLRHDEKQRTDWTARSEAFLEVVMRYRRTDGHPDVVLASSGGKDSTRAATILRDLGLHPLLVTWAPAGYTEPGRRNFYRLIDAGFHSLLLTPNGRVHRALTRYAFRNLGSAFQPFILGQRSLPPRIAAMHGIELVVYAELDGEWEGGNREAAQAWYVGREDVYLGGVPLPQLLRDEQWEPHDLWWYMPATEEEATRIRVIGLSNYFEWHPQLSYYAAVDATGFERNEERTEGSYSVYSSFDDRIDPLHYLLGYAKYGLGRASYDASQEIRYGEITREEGVRLVHQYDHEWRQSTVDWACAYMGLTEAEFWQTVEKFRRTYPRVS